MPGARRRGSRCASTSSPWRASTSSPSSRRTRCSTSPTVLRARPLRGRSRLPRRRARGRAQARLPAERVERPRRDHVPALHARTLGRGTRGVRAGARGAPARGDDGELPQLRPGRSTPRGATLDRAAHVLSLYAPYGESENLQRKSMYLAGAAAVARAHGRLGEALEVGAELATPADWGRGEPAEQARPRRGDRGGAGARPPGTRRGGWSRPSRRSRRACARPTSGPRRFGSVRSSQRRTTPVPECFLGAAKGFRDLGIPFWLAVTLLQQGEWLRA